MKDLREGTMVMTHLTHHHDGSRKGSMKARVVSLCKRSIGVEIRSKRLEGQVFYVVPEAIVGVLHKETLTESKVRLVRKFKK